MKRDPRLQGLSAEHHHALVLARAAARGEIDGAALARRFAAELELHFRVEEELLLPALCDAARLDLSERTRRDHADLRALAVTAAAGDAAAARAFGARLSDHVRFEERELFPACEALLADSVLAAVATALLRAPS